MPSSPLPPNIQSLGTNLLFVRLGATSQGGVFGGLGSASTLTLDDAYALLDPIYAPSVAAVAPELRSSGQVVTGGKNTFTQVVGVTPEYQFVRNVPAASGGFITWGHVENRSEVVVLGSRVQAAEALHSYLCWQFNLAGLYGKGQPIFSTARQYLTNLFSHYLGCFFWWGHSFLLANFQHTQYSLLDIS